MITLYGVPLSPFVRKALLALEYKGLEYDNVPTFPGDESPEFRAISPLGKIPVLDHDGFSVPDTSVICRYLDRIAPEKSLYPQDARLEAQACWLEEYADSRLIELCAGLFRERLLKPKMLNEPTDEGLVQDILVNALPKALTYVETQTPETGYLVGDSLSIADLAVVTCFVQARYGNFEVDGALYPKLRSYLDRAHGTDLLTARLEAEQAAMPPGLN